MAQQVVGFCRVSGKVKEVFLGGLAGRLAQGADAVRELDQTLYAPAAREWQGDVLWQALRGGLRERAAGDRSAMLRGPGLPGLYPERA